MTDGVDALFRPVSHGYYTADKLQDGSIDLEFVMTCNEAIDVHTENSNRADIAARKKGTAPGR